MPTVSFYLKNEDYDKWRALPKPGEFIHNALNGSSHLPTKQKEPLVERFGSLEKMSGKEFGEPKKVDWSKAQAFPISKSCKHGADPKYCKFAKNGKPCK